ncbi:MAG: B12-binding domain-containing radical SAM protein [Desulfomonile tiedjei]|uniref:B12-binding domain-containing radical SAM protein n=1 Tax=Desulfomonile tiedjei TaxID=2358 RepID=A0A9D6Z7M8_9BACT|nr:B12-binding domain-containing radical SAM protein [Desulfomonile tiedjei]
MKVLLTQPAIGESWLSYNRLYAPNLGLLYLAGYLKEFKPGVTIKYLEGHMSADDHVKAVESFQPDVYGITLTAWALPYASATINRVKAVFPSLPIVAGGPYPSINPRAVLEKEAINYCVIGEGEQTFLELVEYLDGKGSQESINGLAYRDEHGEVVVNPKRKAFRDLDELPLPDWSLVDFSKYGGPAISKKRPYGHLSAARGCPHGCIFCSSNAVWKRSGPWVRHRSPEAIAKEVNLLYDYGVREIVLRAGSFNANLKWAKEVCRAIKRLKLKEAVFNCELRCDKVDEEFLGLLHDINMWCVHLGIESSSPRVLKGIGKRYTIEQVTNALEMFKQFGIKVYGYFMMFNFWEDEKGELQIETPDEVNNTLTFIKSASRRGMLHHFSWAFCTPYEGSQLYDIAMRHGLMVGTGPKLANELDSSRLPGISVAVRNKYRRRGMLLQFELALRNGDFNLNHVRRGLANLRYVFARNRHEQWQCEYGRST